MISAWTPPNSPRSPCSRGSRTPQLKQIGSWADEIDVDTGYHLIRRDGFGYEFFAIIDGTAEVMDGERHLADLSAGDFFGEMALLDEERRSASVRATSPMRLMVMTRQEFHSMIAAVPGARRADPREGRRAARQQRALATHEPTRPAVALRRARCGWPMRTHR